MLPRYELMMNAKQILKLSVDILMTILLLLLMAFMLTQQQVHEWLGTGMLVLFVIHHLLNKNWFKAFAHGGYPPLRIFQTLIAALSFLSMLGSMISGIMMSRYVFAWLPFHGGLVWARTLHILFAYWGFFFLSVHLGLHWGMLMGILRNITGLRTCPSSGRVMLRILSWLIAVYGIYSFCKHRIADYLFLKNTFVFFDYPQSPIQFFADYLAMMGLWIFLSHNICHCFRRFTTPKGGRINQ